MLLSTTMINLIFKEILINKEIIFNQINSQKFCKKGDKNIFQKLSVGYEEILLLLHTT